VEARYASPAVMLRRTIPALAAPLAGLALLLTPAALAARTTTAPGKHVLVYFVADDKQIRYQIYRTTAGGGTDQLFLEKWVVRGDNATVIFINRGKRAHELSFYGHRLGPLKPGKRVKFTASLIKRGKFAYSSTTDHGKRYSGVFPVY
jgi:hypothetical protein